MLISVYGWISYRVISHSLISDATLEYDPDSSAWSYTRARPISLPAGVVLVTPILESLRLIVEEVLNPILGAPKVLFSVKVGPVK